MTSPRFIGLILAGGRSRRMGSDKAFVTLNGQPLLRHVMARLAPQVDTLVINSNADPKDFSRFGAPVIPDRLTGYLGPLAGVHAGLSTYPHDFVLTVAVDLPFLPPDLAPRLREQLDGERCPYAGDGRNHALAILWPPGMAPQIEDFLQQGQHSLHAWLTQHGQPVIFAATSNGNVMFNLNTPEDLRRAEIFCAPQASN